MSDHLDRAAEVLRTSKVFRASAAFGVPDEAWVDAATRMVEVLDAAGLLATPEHDAAVAAKAAERVLFVIQDDLDTMRDAHKDAKTWDDALHFVRGYVSGAAINERAHRIERMEKADADA